MAGTRAPTGPHRRLSTRSEQRWNPARTLHAESDRRVSCLIADAVETTSSKFTTLTAIIRRKSGWPAQMLGGARWRPSRHQAVCVLKDVVAQFDRQRPARLSVAILNARRADRFLRRATPWLSKELVLLLRAAFVQMKRENHGSKHRTLWESLSKALRKLAGRECLPTHEEPVEGA